MPQSSGAFRPPWLHDGGHGPPRRFVPSIGPQDRPGLLRSPCPAPPDPPTLGRAGGATGFSQRGRVMIEQHHQRTDRRELVGLPMARRTSNRRTGTERLADRGRPGALAGGTGTGRVPQREAQIGATTEGGHEGRGDRPGRGQGLDVRPRHRTRLISRWRPCRAPSPTALERPRRGADGVRPFFPGAVTQAPAGPARRTAVERPLRESGRRR